MARINRCKAHSQTVYKGESVVCHDINTKTADAIITSGIDVVLSKLDGVYASDLCVFWSPVQFNFVFLESACCRLMFAGHWVSSPKDSSKVVS